MPNLAGSFVFSGASLDGSSVFETGVPALGTLTPGETTLTFTYTGPVTHRRVFPLAGSPGAWVSVGASPVTVSGLTANTEYTLQVSGDGSTVADSEDFGTTNPGSGGGTIPTFGSSTLDAGFLVNAGGFNFSNVGFRVAAAGSAVVSSAFAIQESGIQSLNTGYRVSAAGAATVATGYPVRTSLGSTLDAGFEVISDLSGGSARLSAGYAIGTTGQGVSSVGYAVAAAGIASLNAGFSVAASTGLVTMDAGYAVRALQQANLDVGYVVGFNASNTLSVGYLVESAGIATSNIKMTLRPRISITLKN